MATETPIEHEPEPAATDEMMQPPPAKQVRRSSDDESPAYADMCTTLPDRISSAIAFMMSRDERLGARSAAAMVSTDEFVARTICELAAEDDHSTRLYSWGLNTRGELCHGDCVDRRYPGEVYKLRGSQIVSLASTDGATIFAVGRTVVQTCPSMHVLTDHLGGRDDPFLAGRSLMNACGAMCHANVVVCGFDHTLVLASDGLVYAWGSNNHVQLGTPRDRVCGPVFKPMRVAGIRDVVAIACGGYHAVAATSDGKTFVWGQINNKRAHDPRTPDDEARLLPARILHHVNVVSVAAGESHAAAITSTGELYTWGVNEHDVLGVPDHTVVADAGTGVVPPLRVPGFETKRFKEVACGDDHMLALLETGEVYSWGNGAEGQLGIRSSTTGEPAQVLGLDDIPIMHVRCGSSVSCAFTLNTVLMWGSNLFNLIDSDLDANAHMHDPHKITLSARQRIVDVALTRSSVFVRTILSNHRDVEPRSSFEICTGPKDHKVWASGESGQGLGATVGKRVNDMVRCDKPCVVDELNDLPVRMVATQDDHAYVVLTDGTVMATGQDRCASPSPTPTDRDGTETERRAWTDEDIQHRRAFTRVIMPDPVCIDRVACGSAHTLFLTTTGKLYGVGGNTKGQLGIGNNIPHVTHVTPLPTMSSNVRRIACGAQHSVAILDTSPLPMCSAILADDRRDHIFAWGDNSDGQLGVGDRIDRNTPTQMVAMCRDDIREHVQNPFTMATCSYTVTIMVTESGDAYCCGCECSGTLIGYSGTDPCTQLRPLNLPAFRERRVLDVACGGVHAIWLTCPRSHWVRVIDNHVHSHSGPNQPGELHTSMFATGCNFDGTLGDGSASGHGCMHITEMSDAKVRSVHASMAVSAAVLWTGELYVWGCNRFGVELSVPARERPDWAPRIVPPPRRAPRRKNATTFTRPMLATAFLDRRVTSIACGQLSAFVVTE